MALMDPSRYDYREVACPHCHASAGSYCIRPSGHSGPFVEPHQPRRAAAHVVWRAEEMRLYGKQLTPWDDDPAPVATPAPAAPQQLSLFDQPVSPALKAA